MRWLNGITNSMDLSLSKSGTGDRPGGLACYSPWGHKESDTAERLNQTEYKRILETEEIILVDVLSLQIRKLIQEGVM